MILDGLPLEVIREVLLDLPTVDIIQTVKCTRQLYKFVEFDQALGRRLQNRMLKINLCLDNSVCRCRKPLVRIYWSAISRRANKIRMKNGRFYFWFHGGCKCDDTNGQVKKIKPDLLNRPSFFYDNRLLKAFENETKFAIKSGFLDDAIIDCGKLINILTKFCVVHKFELDLENNDYQMWEQMNAFFNANPPELRIQPCISIPSNTNLDDFLTSSIFQNGLAKIAIHGDSGPILVDAYHEVFRRTPKVYFAIMDVPYTYEDLFGFFRDTKKLSLGSAHRITEQQLCKLVQHFYEVKQDEERMFEIRFDGGFLVKDFLRLIPKEAYRLHLKRSRIVGPELEARTWAKMTDKFGGKWALVVMIMGVHWRFLHICNMKYFTEDYLINLCNEFNPNQFSSRQFDPDQFDSDQSGFDSSDSDQSDSEQFDSDQSDSDQSGFDSSDSD